MSIEFNAQGVRTLRDASGHGIQMVCKAFELARDDARFGGDTVLALAFLDRMGLAIMIHGDKEAWALDIAQDLAERMRKQVEDLRAVEGDAPSP